MHCVSLAESAILLGLHTIGMCLLILGCIIITTLALCACQCDSCTHVFSSALTVHFIMIHMQMFVGISGRSCLRTWILFDRESFSDLPHGFVGLVGPGATVRRAVRLQHKKKTRQSLCN